MRLPFVIVSVKINSVRFELLIPYAIYFDAYKKQERRLDVATSTALFYEKSQEQKSPEFQEKYKKRSTQEWKNGEMKRFHGMIRARGWGLRSVSTQVKLTVIAVNLKRIAALVDIQEQLDCKIIRSILRIEAFLPRFSKSVPLLAEMIAL